MIFLTIAFAERSGPDTNARLVRTLSVMNFTREPPISIARIVGRDARLPAFFSPAFFTMNSRPALPDEQNYSRYAAEIEKRTARSLVLHPTPLCSQRTNRNRANQHEPTPNNRFLPAALRLDPGRFHDRQQPAF